LESETEITKALDHPNIVKLFAIFHARNHLHLVMSFCEGGELMDHIVEGQGHAEAAVSNVMNQVFRALRYMHGQGIVHRDLKPANFLLAKKAPLEECLIKVVDFGVARRFREGEVMRTVAGTTMYTAPEVFAESYDKSAEYWSCGVIMFLLFSGKPPFTGLSDQGLRNNIKRGVLKMEGRLWEAVSQSAKGIVKGLLEKDPKERQTAEEVLQNLWILQADKPRDLQASIPPGLATNLSYFCRQDRFTKAALTAIAHQLEDEDIRNLSELFKALDTKKTGVLTEDEVQEALSNLEGFDDPEEMRQIVRGIDTSNDGSISYTEFIAAAMDRTFHRSDLRFRQAFQAFDRDGNGEITKAEIRETLDTSGQAGLESAVSGDDIDLLFGDLDKDGNGVISLEELTQHMQKDSPPAPTAALRAAGTPPATPPPAMPSGAPPKAKKDKKKSGEKCAMQ